MKHESKCRVGRGTHACFPEKINNKQLSFTQSRPTETNEHEVGSINFSSVLSKIGRGRDKEKK